ncbi:hypothetical protein DIPPA_06603 [Diplonema papillatum]|nr:hypothetical protein DIPPA_06603 [Diplonema papillatum]KAJ9459052.1 hypothetical protein DIPPA_06603 [Diplonema papillatum]
MSSHPRIVASRRSASPPGDDFVDLRFGSEAAVLRVRRDALWFSERGLAYLKGKGLLTWCQHERAGLDCAVKYAEGVGKSGCGFAHIADAAARAHALAVLTREYPEHTRAAGGSEEAESVLQAFESGPFPATAELASCPELLTVVMTTSPTVSNPETALLESVLLTFQKAEGLRSCRLVIVCDGCDIVNPEGDRDSPPHTADEEEGESRGLADDGATGDGPPRGCCAKKKLGYKRGVVTAGAAAAYEEYKKRVRDLAKARGNTAVIELPDRQGFGWAVRAAIREAVRTPFVMVVQHDRYFDAPFSVVPVLQTMLDEPDTYKVVYLPTSSMRDHLNKVRTRLVGIAGPNGWDDPLFTPRTSSSGLTLNPLLAWLDMLQTAGPSHWICTSRPPSINGS